jgi:hypothetical protein
MSSATIIMVVFICVGSAAGLAGLAVAGYRAHRLYMATMVAGISSRAHLQLVMGRAARLEPRVRELQVKQKAVAEKITDLSTTAQELRLFSLFRVLRLFR